MDAANTDPTPFQCSIKQLSMMVIHGDSDSHIHDYLDCFLIVSDGYTMATDSDK